MKTFKQRVWNAKLNRRRIVFTAWITFILFASQSPFTSISTVYASGRAARIAAPLASPHHHDHSHEHAHEHDHEDSDGDTAEDHFQADNITLDPIAEAQMAASLRPGHGMRPLGAEAVVDPGIGGSWSAVQNWPIAAVHAHLMPDGTVLAFDSGSDAPPQDEPVHTRTRALLWNPATNAITRVDANTGYDLFCSGHAHLPNGSLYVAGGTLNANLDGIDKTHLFDAQSKQWSVESTMAYARWYPTVTPLSNGEMLITSGRTTGQNRVPIPEVRAANGTLRTLADASLNLLNYPWMHTGPNGKVFVFGPAPQLYALDTSGSGSWQSIGQRDNSIRNYGSHAMYDIGKVLVSGGGNSFKTSRIVDINGSAPVVSTAQSMAFGRRQHNLTLLADGSVLATGGNSSGASFIDFDSAVYEAELWNPATGKWTTLASMQVTRQYHSVALLLPDGRVLTAGGGLCADCVAVGYLAKNAEVFSPPYLFKRDGSGELAPRPIIDSAPASVGYGAQFTVQMRQNAPVQKVGLVRLGSVTHSVNMEQRYIPLQFTRSGRELQVAAPANNNIAPIGYYMLFVVDGSGVPSVASMVQVKNSSTPPPPPPSQNDLIFADDFESGTLNAWSARATGGGDLSITAAAALVNSRGLQAVINDNTALNLRDDRPNAEKRYYARFHFDPNAISMAQGDMYYLFRGFSGTSLAVLQVLFRYNKGQYEMRAGLLDDGSTWRYLNWFSVADAPHLLEIDWRAASSPGANNGSLTFLVDGAARPQLSGIDNDTRQIDAIRLGAVTGIDPGTRGTIYFDAFVSQRSSAASTALAETIHAGPSDWTDEEMTPEDMQPPAPEEENLYLPRLSRQGLPIQS